MMADDRMDRDRGASVNGNDDPVPQLTDEELRWFRKRKADDEHAQWALRTARRWFFYLTGAMAALWATFDWLSKHVTFKIGG
jgi:hypothetical protein